MSARKRKVKIGYMACETCGERVVLKRNEQNTLSYSCDECGAAPHAQEGIPAHDLWLSKATMDAPKTAPVPAPAAEEKPQSGGAGFFS